MPPAEHVHWWFASGMLMLGLFQLGEVVVGTEVWRLRAWRAYLWPGLLFTMGVVMWPVMTFYTNSTIHMVAHGSWAEVLMLSGAAELALVRGKLQSRYWHLTVAFAMVVSGLAFLIHEKNPWFFARSAFLHHALGWMLLGAALIPLGQVLRPSSKVFATGFALVFVVLAVMLYSDRDVAPVFGHLSPVAGAPHR
jgi:hypothetical protein